MVPKVGNSAPEFSGKAVMPDGLIKTLTLSEFKGKKYVLLIFYPYDFTYVCPSEILAFNKAIGDFESRNVQVIVCSIDSVYVHTAWRATPTNRGGIGEVSFPMMGDVSKEIAKTYGVLLDEGMALRGSFLIDKAGVLQQALVNNLPIGRSVDESLRVIDALQFVEEHGEVCPANWRKGNKGMKPTSQGVAEYLSQNA